MSELTLWLVSRTDVSHFRWGCFCTLIFSKLHLSILSFWCYHLIFCQDVQIDLIFWQTSNTFKMKGQFWLFGTDVGVFHDGWTRWTLFNHVTICFNGLWYVLPLMLPYFYGRFVRFQRTTIFSLLLYLVLYPLLYIFSEISSFLYDFQRVTKPYNQVY